MAKPKSKKKTGKYHTLPGFSEDARKEFESLYFQNGVGVGRYWSKRISDSSRIVNYNETKKSYALRVNLGEVTQEFYINSNEDLPEFRRSIISSLFKLENLSRNKRQKLSNLEKDIFPKGFTVERFFEEKERLKSINPLTDVIVPIIGSKDFGEPIINYSIKEEGILILEKTSEGKEIPQRRFKVVYGKDFQSKDFFNN